MYLGLEKGLTVQHSRATQALPPAGEAAARTNPTTDGTAAFAPPPHSIAVLPFVNMSGDREQDYFSDGLTEELLNSLSRINELQVAARTSSFYFKGEHADLPSIAHKLNVASVLEGSVRRSGHTIRVTAQLTDARSGFHLWSETYDRELSDVLQLETEIANSVANALKVTLLTDVAARIQVGGTRNPAAFDAYLHALNADYSARDAKGAQAAIDGFTQAIRLDPDYGEYSQFAVKMGRTDQGLAIAQRAVVLDPLNPWNHAALGYALVFARRYEDGIAAYMNAKALTTNGALAEFAEGMIGIAYYDAGDFQRAQLACEGADDSTKYYCLAMAYDKLGRRQHAEAALARLRTSQVGKTGWVD